MLYSVIHCSGSTDYLLEVRVQGFALNLVYQSVKFGSYEINSGGSRACYGISEDVIKWSDEVNQANDKIMTELIKYTAPKEMRVYRSFRIRDRNI